MIITSIVQSMSNCAISNTSNRHDITSICFFQIYVDYAETFLDTHDLSLRINLTILQDSVDFVTNIDGA